jgi:hypothetical protein
MEKLTTIKNLEGLKAALEQKRATSLKEQFDKILSGKFNAVPNGNFQTKLKGIDSVSIVRQKGGGGLSVILYRDGGKRHETLSLFSDGTVSGKIPEGVLASRQDILEEVLRIVDLVGVEAWHHVSDEMLPEGPWFPEQKTDKIGGGKKGVDPERIRFLAGQDDFLFGFDGGNSGFRGYYGYVFPWGVVLEKGEWQNAAYFIDFPKLLEKRVAESARTPPSGARVSRDKLEEIRKNRDAILKKYWQPIEGATKWEARKILDLDFFIHRDYQQKKTGSLSPQPSSERTEELPAASKSDAELASWQKAMERKLDQKRGRLQNAT